MEDRIMNYDDVMDAEVLDLEPVTKNSGMSTGVAMAIGAGLGLAVTATIKLGKKLYAAHKAKKEAKRAEEELEEVAD